jgi:glycosyltransferase involved in cell wall biosynthesis
VTLLDMDRGAQGRRLAVDHRGMPSGPDQVTTSIVIPARNAEAVLGAQLEGLAGQDHDGTWEVVVADNGSTDGTATLVERWVAEFPTSLRVVDASRNRGINAARNSGVAHTTSERLLFCDADDIVAPSWVRSMVAALDCGDIAGTGVELERLNQPEVIRRRSINAPWCHEGMMFPIGASMGVRRNVWDAVGGFDESFNHGGWDELDFCYAAQRLGFSLAWVDEPLLHYRIRPDWRGTLRQQFGVGRGEQQFRVKHPEYLPPGSVRSELSSWPRALGGACRRLLTRPERGEALGVLTRKLGRDYEMLQS